MNELTRMQFPVERGTMYITETEDSLVLSYRVTHKWRHLWTLVSFVALISFAFAVGGPFSPLMILVPLLGYGLYAATIHIDEQLCLGPTGLDYERRLFIPIRHRHIPPSDLKYFEAREVRVREYKRFAWHHCLCISTTGRPLHFAAGMTGPNAQEMAELATHFCQAHYADLVPAVNWPRAERAESPAVPEPSAPVSLRPPDALAEPPADSQFWLRDGLDTVEFGRRCRWRVARIRRLVCLNVPVNGLLALLLRVMLSPADPAPLLIWVVFSPLFAAGAAILAWLLWELSVPGWHRIWRFGPNGAACGYRRLGLNWLKRFPLPSDDTGTPCLARLVFCKRHSAHSRRASPFGQPRRDAPFAISIVQKNEMEWLRVEGLTDGEARWIAGILFTRFGQWFTLDAPKTLEDAAELSGCPVDRAVAVALESDRMLLTYHDRQPGRGWTLLLALFAWSILCLVMGVIVSVGPGLGNIMVAVAFFTIWLMIVYQLVIADRTWEYVRLSAEGLAYRRGVWRRGIRLRIPLRDLKPAYVGLNRLPLGPRAASSPPPRRENCLVFDSTGEPTRFAAGITGAEAQWLVSAVNRYLDTIHPADEAIAGLALPADSPMQTVHTAHVVTFLFRGRRQARLTLGATLAALIATGLMGGLVFWPLWHWSIVLLPLLLWPALGFLAVLAVWFACLTAPAWCLAWTFQGREVRRVYRAFGFAYTRCYWIRACAPQVCRFDEDRRTELGCSILSHPLVLLRPEAHWGVRFEQGASTSALEIDGLTEGEARHIASLSEAIASSHN